MSNLGVQALSNVIKDVIKNVSKYYNIYDFLEEGEEVFSYEINNYINKDLEDISNKLKENNITPIILGDGKKIINQYPVSGSITKEDRIFLVTNGDEFIMPDITGYSKNEVITLCNLLGINYTISGNGYVKNQSIKKGEKVNKESILEINLNLLYTNE